MNSHECNSLPEHGVYLDYDDDTPSWILCIQREATESDLEEYAHLENVGDIIWLTRLSIQHCPFCGKQLPGLESVNQADQGRFEHFDYSRWW
jgi:hypothetical protein